MANRRAMKLSIELLAMIEEFVQRLWQKEQKVEDSWIQMYVTLKKKEKNIS